jgi:hypothetical protein
LTALSQETGLHPNTLKTLIAHASAARFSPDGQDFGLVYLRKDAEQVLSNGRFDQ